MQTKITALRNATREREREREGGRETVQRNHLAGSTLAMLVREFL